MELTEVTRKNHATNLGISVSSIYSVTSVAIVYSVRSATMGSTLVARRAGSQQAAMATLANKTATPENVPHRFL